MLFARYLNIIHYEITNFKDSFEIAGDITQIDLPARIPSGLVHALEILNAIPEIGMVSMEAEDVVRNPLVKKIVQAYENNKNND